MRPIATDIAIVIDLDDQRWEVIRWLSSTDMSTNHEAACKEHELTTGDWFVRSSDFTRWKTDPGGFIWLHGFGKFHSIHPIRPLHYVVLALFDN